MIQFKAHRPLLFVFVLSLLQGGCVSELEEGSEPFYLDGSADGFGASLRVPFRDEDLVLDIGAGFTDYFHYDTGQGFQPIDDPNYRDFVHGGIDFRVPAGTEVITMEAGTIIDRPTYPMRPGVSVTVQGDNGRRWVYAHIDYDTIPEDLQSGDTVERGQFLGSIIRWFDDQIDISDNGRYDHLHLDVYEQIDPITDIGLPSNERLLNIDRFLGLPDSTEPRLVALHFLRAGERNVLASLNPETQGAPVINGRVELVLQAFDYRNRLMLGSEGELTPLEGSSFPTGIASAEVQILSPEDASPVFSAVCPGLESLPGDWDEREANLLARYRRVLFFDGEEVRAVKDRFVKRTFINLVHQEPEGELIAAVLDTTTFQPGSYTLVVTLWDEAGNDQTYEFEVIFGD